MQRRGQATNRSGGKRELLHPHPSIRLRIGINSGPVVAGIVGTHKFAYDLWGDTVEEAQRLNEGTEPGSVRVSDQVRDALGEGLATTTTTSANGVGGWLVSEAENAGEETEVRA